MSASPTMSRSLLDAGRRAADVLMARGETVSVAECSCGGLVSAALLAVPGASRCYVGGTVVYTKAALEGLLRGRVDPPAGLRGASEPWARHLAQAARAHLGSDWAIGEGGAAGPDGNPYGDPAGHAWVAVSGPVEATRHVLTGQGDRVSNMASFAIEALDLLAVTVASSDGRTG